MQEKENLEELFKEAFRNYEEPVRPELWSKVSEAINAPATPTDISSSVSHSASTGSGFLGGITSYIAGAVLVSGTLAGIYYYTEKQSVTEEQPSTVQEVQLQQDQPDAVVNTNQIETGAEEKTSPSPNKDQSASSGLTPMSGNKANQHVTHTLSSENTGSEAQLSVAENQTQNASSGTTARHEVQVPSEQSNTGLSNQNQQANNNQQITPSFTDSHNSTEAVSEVAVSAFPQRGVAPLTVAFSASGLNENAEWMMGDGTVIRESGKIEHIFEKPGNYLVLYRGTDLNGKSVNKQLRIEVLVDLEIRNIPNVFTPNGDGLNDIFTFDSSHLTDFEMILYDQSGKKIHSFNKTEGGWNGKLNSGQDAQEGTYFYVIFATGENNRQNTQKGTIKLMR